jgi:tetratricopeptide (TPR) repeat protein
MLAITHNNRGIIYYIKEEFEKAEDDWNKARKYTKDAGSRYIEGAVFNNLAGIELIKGNMEKSWKYTQMAFERFREVNDLEGVSWCDFQLAEYYLENKDLENAKLHYHKSGSIGHLSLSPGERKMRKEIFLERGMKNGFSEVQLKKIIEA